MDFTKILRQAQLSGSLQIVDTPLQIIPDEVYQVNVLMFDTRGFYENKEVTKFIIKNCGLTQISADIALIDQLKVVDLQSNKLQKIPTFNLQNLVYLNLDNNKLFQFPDLSQLPFLEQLYINKNLLQGSVAIDHNSLKIIELSGNKISSIQMQAPQLHEFKADHNIINKIEFNDQSLLKLDLSFNQISTLVLDNLVRVDDLNLESNKLNITEQFQQQISTLSAKIINLSSNNCQCIFIHMFTCKNLVELYLKYCHVNVFDFSQSQELSTGVMKQSKLRFFDLSNNDLQEVAPELGISNQINKINVIGNPMRKMAKLLQVDGDKMKNYLIDKLPINHFYHQKLTYKPVEEFQEAMQNQIQIVQTQQKRQLELQEQSYFPSKRVPQQNQPQKTQDELDYEEYLQLKYGQQSKQQVQQQIMNRPQIQQQVQPRAVEQPKIEYQPFVPQQQQYKQSQVVNPLQQQLVIQDVAEAEIDLQHILSAEQIQQFKMINVPIQQEFFEKITKRLQKYNCLQHFYLNRLHKIQEIHLNGVNNLRNLEIFQMKSLQFVCLQNLPALQQLIVSQTHLVELQMQNCPQITQVQLKSNSLDQIPENLFQLKNIIELDVSGNQIKQIPDEIQQFAQLQVLNISTNQIRIIPNSVGKLRNLQQFNFEGNIIIKPSAAVQKRGGIALVEFLRGE
ncbi:Leucine-rich_repeat protein [Hexamita inflata]|uniref:Leucine-rich repeat protein n=1 Tax=Hexamita inflata TaxID=28002 RepID=A0AA86PW51_9EUKA|nr:Leucine-rich repeat protein [Hexamita inflata]